MKIIQVPIKDLKFAEYNPRKANEKEVADLKESLKRFGFVEPIVVNSAPKRHNIIIGGHFRTRVAKDMGMKSVPVVYVNIPDIKKEKELNLRLNKNLGSWDWAMLANFDDEMLQEVGWDSAELDNIFQLADKEDPFNLEEELASIKKPISKVGDVYQLGNHRLMCGNSTKKEDVEKLMGGEKADMVFTDPPYGINYYSPGGLDKKPLKKRRERDVKGDNLELREFIKLIGNSFNNLGEFGKNGSPIYICSNYKAFSFFEQQLLKNNFHISAIIIWVKNNTTTPLGTAGDYAHKNEWIIKTKKKSKKAQPIIYGWKEGKHYFSETAFEADVWEIKRRAGNMMIHPTQKPLELICRAIRNSSKREEIVLDLFGGSGSTLIAAEQEGRQAFLMELDPKFVDIIIKRWETFTGKFAKLEKRQ